MFKRNTSAKRDVINNLCRSSDVKTSSSFHHATVAHALLHLWNKRFYVWLPKNNVPFHGTFSRHGKAQASLALLICLNEKVPFHKIRERDNDHRLRIFPFTHKKECAAINGDASRMIFKDPKSLNLKTTIVNSNKNALFGLPIRFVGGGLVITHKSERFVTLPISCFFLLMC